MQNIFCGANSLRTEVSYINSTSLMEVRRVLSIGPVERQEIHLDLHREGFTVLDLDDTMTLMINPEDYRSI
jgi:hypothetical protein